MITFAKLFFLYVATASLLALTPLYQPEKNLGFGDTITGLQQWTATTTPFTAVTPKPYGKNVYITGNATTSQFAITGRKSCDTLDTDSAGNIICGTDATGAAVAGGSGSVGTSTTPTIGQIPFWTSSGATPELLGSTATTTLTATSPLSLSNAISVLGSSASAISISTAGTWSGNAGTASALFANGGNCSSGSAPLGVDASGASESCFTVMSSLNGLTGNSQTFATTTSDGGWGFGSATTIHTLNIPTAKATNPLGLLSGSDWTTFNSKQASITDGTGLTFAGATLNCDTASANAVGCLSTADWTLFNGRVATTSIDTLGELETLWGSINVLTETEIDASSELLALMDDETGTGLLTFATAPTFTTSIQVPLILTGNVALTIGDATTDSITFTADGTGNAEFTFPADVIGDADIDWGSGAGQVDLADIPGGISGASVWDFGGATSVEIPNGAAPTVDATGECALDTTSDQLACYGATAKKIFGNGYIYPSFTYSTSTAWTATTTIPLGTSFVAETWTGVQCFTDTGTLNVQFGDGTNKMILFNASTTVGTVGLSTNNTFTAAEKRYVDIGTPASTPTRVSCTISKELTSD